MVPVKYFVSISLILISVSSRGQSSEEIKLPLKIVTGYGPFQVDKTSITFSPPPSSHPLYKSWASLKFKGVPANLKAVEKGIIWIDFLQFLYQNAQTGNLPLEFYQQFRKDRQITTAEEGLSRLPIGCYILLVKGINGAGKEILLIDTNNDSNFADESPIAVSGYLSDRDFSERVGKSIQVRYQTVFQKKLVSRTIPLLVLKNRDQYLYSFPQYAVATLKQKSGNIQIAVSHEFHFPNFEIANVTLFSNQQVLTDSVARKNQYLTIGEHTYKNKGVDLGTLSLILEKTNAPIAALYGAQKGMQAIAFNGKDVVTEHDVALSDFKGKYLFIDFWGSWCSPCVGQLKKLGEIYASVDKTKVAFVGVAGRDDIDKMKRMIVEKHLLWPNIFSDQTNQIVEKYNIMMYPTGLLIDPSGKVIETEVSSANLEMLLKKHQDN